MIFSFYVYLIFNFYVQINYFKKIEIIIISIMYNNNPYVFHILVRTTEDMVPEDTEIMATITILTTMDTMIPITNLISLDLATITMGREDTAITIIENLMLAIVVLVWLDSAVAVVFWRLVLDDLYFVLNK